jgi:hypothetical protein
VVTGVLLSVNLALALLAANRMPRLESLALVRDLLFAAILVLFMLIPICRFWRSPVRLFISGMVAWGLFIVSYVGMGNIFVNLYERVRTPGVVLAYGAAAYGLISVISWVSGMIHQAVYHPPISVRRPPRHAHHHR